jgi:hypothetical protein
VHIVFVPVIFVIVTRYLFFVLGIRYCRSFILFIVRLFIRFIVRFHYSLILLLLSFIVHCFKRKVQF